MLSLNSYARQKFFMALEAKLLKLIQNPVCNGFGREKISSLKQFNKKSFRLFSTEKTKDEIVKLKSSENEVSTNIIETVKETTKTVYYSGVILIGLSITGAICYILFSELFSKNSANSIYSKALDRCLKNEKVVFHLGEPIKAYGEEDSRGRRRHVNHLVYTKDGVNYMRMKFYIRGCRKKATVHLEMKTNENNNYEYRYFFVQLDEYPYTTIILEDNRVETPSVKLSVKDENVELLQ